VSLRRKVYFEEENKEVSSARRKFKELRMSDADEDQE
jgi:hypothetical protein